MISANTTMKITIEMICGVVNSGIYTTPNLTPFPEERTFSLAGSIAPITDAIKQKKAIGS